MNNKKQLAKNPTIHYLYSQTFFVQKIHHLTQNGVFYYFQLIDSITKKQQVISIPKNT